MVNPLINQIVEEGLSSVNVAMLPLATRHKVMTDAGNTLLHLDRNEEAAKAFAIAENKEALKEHGNWFLKRQRLGIAALFLLHVEKEEKLHELAKDCIASNNIAAAEAIYEMLNDQTMLAFIKENLRTT